MRRGHGLIIRKSDFMTELVAELITLAPDSNPNQIGIIIPSVNERLKELHLVTEQVEVLSRFDTFRNDWMLEIRPRKGDSDRCLRIAIFSFLDYLMEKVPEIRQLNLTFEEWERGLRDPDDPSRPMFTFTTRYDRYTEESWKSDFIDLDALKQNMAYRLARPQDHSDDCGICENADTVVCNTCIYNSAYQSHYTSRRKPKGNRKTACKFDCVLGYYICCTECEERDTCSHVCDASIEDCGNAIYKDGKKVK